MQEEGKIKVDAWVEECGMDPADGALVLKPAEEGSSINVRFAFGIQDAVEHAHDLLANEDARMVRAAAFLVNFLHACGTCVAVACPQQDRLNRCLVIS
jgi:hypothetical protein